ncbi:MAG: 50S ribosomal protein L17 [Bacteroidales bacterium]|nr:50S ribosomal protein L17 [Bacteroidales bacterium]
MRHRKSFNHLGRKKAHRSAMLSNMASSLIMSKKIETTVAKAKALRSYIEPLITKSKDDSTHSRRVVFSYLQNKESVTELFREIAVKISERPGGYTRILKTGNRLGDNAEMCIIELVDYNENMLAATQETKAKTTKRRKRAKKKTTTAQTEITVTPTEKAALTEEVTSTKEVAPIKETETKETETKVEDNKQDIVEKVVESKEEKKTTEEKPKKDIVKTQDSASKEETKKEEKPKKDIVKTQGFASQEETKKEEKPKVKAEKPKKDIVKTQDSASQEEKTNTDKDNKEN